MENNISSYDLGERSFRKLRPSFTKEESKFLLELMGKYKSVLIDKNKGFVTVEQRREAWQNIADELNRINPNVHRSCEEVKKRWQNLVYQATKDAQKLKGFYPGEAPRVSEVSMGILTLIEEWPESMDSQIGNNTSGCKIEFEVADNEDDNTNTMVSDSPHSHQDDQNSYMMNTSAAACAVRRSSVEPKDSSVPVTSSESIIQPAFPQRSMELGYSGLNPQQQGGCNSNYQGGSNLHNQNNSEGSSLPSDALSVTSAPIRSKYLHPAYRDASLSSQNFDVSGGPSAKRRCFDFFSGNHDLETGVFDADSDAIVLDKEKIRLDVEKLEMAKEHMSIERQKLNMEKEKFKMEMELERDKLRFERERFTAEKERDRQQLIMEKEKFFFMKESDNERTRLLKEQHETEKLMLAMEKEKLSLEIQFWKRKLLQSTANHDESEEHSTHNNVDH